MTIELARRFVELTRKRDELADALKAVEAERAFVGEGVIEFLHANGLRNLPFTDLGVTVYAQETIGAKELEGVDPDHVTEVLVAHGGHPRVYAQNRDAIVREIVRAQLAELAAKKQPRPADLTGLLPDGLRSVLTVTTRVQAKMVALKD